jgi:putative transposase
VPGRNIVKQYGANEYYHIYSRGVAKQAVFLDDQDYSIFLKLLKRYLAKEKQSSRGHGTYPNYSQRIELLAYCLMPNHFHLLIYQHDEKVMVELMRSVMTSYSMYFNRKYKRVGPVFQSRYRASLISQEDYLEHISRYIHLNPREWEQYPYSSIRYYQGKTTAEWVNPTRILDIFPSKEQYLEFVRDYEGYKEMLDEIHWELADQ